ncbi:MAG: response regulator [Betaproteobacteria bacterium]|nr:response regulator [Betaproteobacteria bacterium]
MVIPASRLFHSIAPRTLLATVASWNCRSVVPTYKPHWSACHPLPIATRPAIPPIARSTVARSERKILLAEDNVVNQRVALSMLQSLSYYATLAQDGKDALDALAKEEFDIVLMNCHMPNMDGFEAVVAIRNNESGRSTGPRQYIGAVTANAINGERERCLAAEFDDYLSKPFTRAQLAELIERSPIAKAIGA